MQIWKFPFLCLSKNIFQWLIQACTPMVNKWIICCQCTILFRSLNLSDTHTHKQTNKHTQTTFSNWKFLVLFSSSLVRSIFILNQPSTPNPRSGVNTLHYTPAFSTYYTHISVDKQMAQVYPVTELQACLKSKQASVSACAKAEVGAFNATIPGVDILPNSPQATECSVKLQKTRELHLYRPQLEC